MGSCVYRTIVSGIGGADLNLEERLSPDAKIIIIRDALTDGYIIRLVRNFKVGNFVVGAPHTYEFNFPNSDEFVKFIDVIDRLKSLLPML